MKVRKYIILVLIYLIFVQTVFISCKKDELNGEIEENNIQLDEGAYVATNNEENLIYNLENNEVIESDKIITNYNLAKKTYIYFLNGYYYFNYKGEEHKINESKIYHSIISPNGEYLLYLVKDQYILPKVLKLSENKEISIENEAIISGEYIDWFTEDKLAYYGVNTSNKEAGIYTYDINSKKEELIYKIDDGFVQYFKYVGNGIAFVKQFIDGNTMLKLVNVDGTVLDISNDVKEIYDSTIINEDVYFLGRMKDNTYSLYRASDNSIKRLVFDFPKNVNIEKGLSQDKDGNLLFIGSNDNNDENVFTYKSDGEVALISNKPGNYNFININ